MLSLLLTFVVFAQGIPALPTETGTITGILRNAEGKPAERVRVAAVTEPDSPDEIASVSAFASIAETDEQGRYRLQNVPPGRYYIAAGRVDMQTYYPGTLDISAGTAVLVSPREMIIGMDFAMKDTSIRPLDPLQRAAAGVLVPIKVTIEGDAKLPLSAHGKHTVLRLDRSSPILSTSVPLTSPVVQLPDPVAIYRARLENLPVGYATKAIRFGSMDLMTSPLAITLADLPPLPGGTPGTVPHYLNVVGTSPVTSLSSATVNALLSVGATTQTVVTTPSLSITLTATRPPRPDTGVRVTGNLQSTEPRSIYLSGTPGTVYSDGTFEFNGVPPGRHMIVTVDNPRFSRPLAGSVIVGDRDLDGVVLDESPLLPAGIRSPSPPGPANGRLPGSLPLASVRGRLTEETTRQPIREGTVLMKAGGYNTVVKVDAEGKFEIPKVLPGTYDIEVQIFGHGTVNQSVFVGEEDINLTLTAARFF